MIIEKIRNSLTDKEKNMITLIKTNRLKIRYSKLLNMLSILIRVTKYKTFSMQILPYLPFSTEQGHIDLGINICYRLKNVDHIGCDIELNLIFMTINLEFSDWRHLEDYNK